MAMYLRAHLIPVKAPWWRVKKSANPWRCRAFKYHVHWFNSDSSHTSSKIVKKVSWSCTTHQDNEHHPHDCLSWEYHNDSFLSNNLPAVYRTDWVTAISWSLSKLHGLLTGLPCAVESFVTTPGSLRRSRTFAVPECVCHHICAWSTETKRNYHHIVERARLHTNLHLPPLICGCSSDWKMHIIGYSSPY